MAASHWPSKGLGLRLTSCALVQDTGTRPQPPRPISASTCVPPQPPFVIISAASGSSADAARQAARQDALQDIPALDG
jgi:hypothetical protein